jgi:hypothetical protein
VINPIDLGATGDGAADDSAFLLAAVATGEDVHLSRGAVFRVDGVVLQPCAGQKFTGGGRLRKTVHLGDYPSQFIKVHGVDGVEVDGIEFENVGCKFYAVTIEAATFTRVRNCRTIRAPLFIWKNSSHTSLIGNRMATGKFGIAVGGDAAGNTSGLIRQTRIADNVIQDMDTEGIDLNWDIRGAWVERNTLLGNNVVAGEEEIDLGGGDCDDIWIERNFIDGAGRSSIGIGTKLNAAGASITGNRILNCQHGLNFQNGDRFIVADNRLYGNAATITGQANLTNSIVQDNLS